MANSKVRWGGTTEDGRTTSTIWGNNSFTWGDVVLAAEIAEIISDDGVGYTKRKERLDDLYTGLTVFCTDSNKLYIYNTDSWVSITLS